MYNNPLQTHAQLCVCVSRHTNVGALLYWRVLPCRSDGGIHDQSHGQEFQTRIVQVGAWPIYIAFMHWRLNLSPSLSPDPGRAPLVY